MSPENQKEKLKRHFAKRVTTQARIVLDTWQRLEEHGWLNTEWILELQGAVQKLHKLAERFEQKNYIATSKAIHTALCNAKFKNGQMRPKDKALVDEATELLRRIVQRKSDTNDRTDSRVYIRTPIYFASNDAKAAERIINQMEFFGFRAEFYGNAEELIHASKLCKPEAIVMDVHFGGQTLSGIKAAQDVQALHDTPIPIIYLSEDGDIATRLAAVRSGGEEFFHQTVDPGQLIEKIEQYTTASPQEPYRVLVLDDSKAQSKFIENALVRSGMITHVINDPMEILIALDDFLPEIIILDMYMPGCTGMELAKVIRQQDRLHSVPIIYLSAEDDVNKQLHAMSLGGDDFLTKPIDPKHLSATIHNRGRRARSLLALMIRDSLTGLYNHTHTLYLLETEISKAKQKQTSLCFVMLDIDYFKRINDTYGHPIGDRVLKSLAMFLKQRLRKTDHIGRYGGEEFAIVLPSTQGEDARNLLNEIRDHFSNLKQPAGDIEFQVTFSCGIAIYSGESAQELSEKADKALYNSKHSGRNQVTIYRQS
ncbi:MAG: diguanylate cyclase [Pseudomonadales bacterium]|nr:diguanylate cyclase [Pseudomonadales bacterium]